MLKTIARNGGGVLSGSVFPSSPVLHQLFVITGADVCVEGSGSDVTLCRWDGADWVEAVPTSTAVTGWPTVNVADGVTWANSFATAFKVGKDTSNYWALYHDPTDGLQFIGVCAGVANGCNYGRQLASGKNYFIRNSGGTDIFTVTESTGAITNATLNAESTGNTITLPDNPFWEIGACQAGVAYPIWNIPASNAPSVACDPDSAPEAYASFDATTDESIMRSIVLPTGFTGAIDVHFIWKAAATSGAVGWCAQLVRVPDGTTSGQSVPAQAAGNCVSDTAKGTTLQENHATITGVTCTSCVARDRVKLQVSRDANGGAVTDDMTGDAHLIAVGITWRSAK